MRLQRSIGKDVLDVEAAAHVAADEDGAVAFERVFLGTEQSEAKLFGASSQPLDTAQKSGGLGDQVVAGDAIDVAFALRAPGAQRFAHGSVVDLRAAEAEFEDWLAELGKPRAERGAANISEGTDVVKLEQLQEVLPGVHRVTDSEELWLHG